MSIKLSQIIIFMKSIYWNNRIVYI